ncbi:MAG TPA: hypothetical protein IAB44_02110 [Candidatus Limivivens intestinipullorum]|uniref:DUF3784 domain-containing protein n=1 Tax=Candidatus Limivivens intestinipullorum TaxID=2840858 RepID=A0A9D1JJ54_9FIRM|nr:hypothetical protein [Candidatus Limivivens intestinipullorum]
MDMFVLMDLLITAFGGYILYGWRVMSEKGEVKENILLTKDISMKQCNDKEGFIRFIQPKLLIFGIATIVCGLLGLVNDLTGMLGTVYIAVTVIFVVFVIWFAVTIRSALKKYFRLK